MFRASTPLVRLARYSRLEPRELLSAKIQSRTALGQRADTKSPKKTLRVTGVLLLFVFSVAASVYTAPGRGRLSARFDLWRGHYIVLACGLPSPWRPEYEQPLPERYGIEIHSRTSIC